MSPATVVKKKRASAKAVTGLGAAAFAHQQLKKGPWTAEEDKILKNYMMEHEEGNWNALPKNSGLQRCGKSCRLRWVNQLRPNLKKGPFSPEEELLICQLHNDFGNKWAHMAKKLPGRSDNKIKNYWNTRINRRKRAGLPPEIQHHVSLRSHEQGQNAPAPWLGNSLPALKPLQSTLSSSFISATPLLSQNQYESVFQSPNRVKNISFGSPCFTSPIQHGLENFDLGPPSYSGKTELPSSQFSSNYWGEQMPLANSGLLSDLFQASHMEGKFLSSTILAIDLFGIKVVDEMLKANGPSAIGMILAEMAPPKTGLPDLYNNCSSAGEFSNCPSSVTTDEEIGLDVPQPEWSFDHCTGGI